MGFLPRLSKYLDGKMKLSKRRRKRGWEAEAGEMERRKAVPGGDEVSGTCHEVRAC